MEYTILEGGTTISTTIWTTVKFNFMDEPIDIPHFEPKSEADIILGIENRYITELDKLNNTEETI